MQFYVLDKKNRFNDREYCFGEPINHNTGDFENCETCGLAVSSREWLPPYTIKLSKPVYGDVVLGTFVTFLASEKFKNEFEASGLIGIYNFQPVTILKVNQRKNENNQLPNYYYVSIVRSKAKIDEKLSRLVREGSISCEICRSGRIIKSLNRLVLENGTWEGQDIFFPTGLPGTILVSQRFYDFVRDNSFTNIDFVPAEKYKSTWV